MNNKLKKRWRIKDKTGIYSGYEVNIHYEKSGVVYLKIVDNKPSPDTNMYRYLWSELEEIT